MDTDFEFLTSIYQNCQTAIQSIENIESATQSEELRSELREEKEHYQSFANKCIANNTEDKKLPDNNLFEKAKLWTSIKMTTLTNKSTRHIAEMMLIGTVMGTLQCYKDLADYKEADAKYIGLCEELQNMEEQHFNNLKNFLKSDIVNDNQEESQSSE